MLTLSKLQQIETSSLAGTRVQVTPRATRYAELGGSCNSEVNKGNQARQGSI